MTSYAGNVRDSYTGYLWCGHGLHLLTPEAKAANGRCRRCQADARARLRRAARAARSRVRGS